MSPEQKHILVENLQDIGYCVGFCGDGANDCGALKSADVGLSLSEAEASVAAPFTSQSTSLDCVPRLISEGRAALVTSFSCFKYMALYSLIQFTSVTLLYSIGGNLGDFQYLFIDLAIIIPVATSMSRSKPEPKLAVKRPTASLVSKRVLTSLIGQTMIQAVAQIGIYYWIRSQPYYIKPDTSVDERRLKCFENTVVFLVSCYQYIMVAFVFSVGEPYREALWKNGKDTVGGLRIRMTKLILFPCQGIFAVTSLLLLAFIILVTVYPVDLLTEWLELVELPPSARAVILAVVLLNGLFSWICERWVFSQVASLIGRFMIERDSVRIRGLQRLSPTDEESRSLLPHSTVVEDSRQEARKERWKKKGKLFKVVEAEMRSEAS